LRLVSRLANRALRLTRLLGCVYQMAFRAFVFAMVLREKAPVLGTQVRAGEKDQSWVVSRKMLSTSWERVHTLHERYGT
jgi:hypothetical protein